MLEGRSHPDTGERCYQHLEWSPPPRQPAREWSGVRGDPFLSLLVCADRLEVRQGWCFSSGHMERYEEELELVLRRGAEGWPAGLRAAVRERFGEAIAAEVAALLADERAFARPG